jgi:LmbE family N-acetylglucosaminyl deacetylase
MLREAHVTFGGTELPHKSLNAFGPTTIVAPHPDDETLACGGLIALLHRNKQPVSIVVVSDGGNSHPNSKAFTREAFISTRKIEVMTAVQELGVTPADVQFLDYPDGEVASDPVSAFPAIVKHVRSVLETLNPSTLIIPFRGDSNADHTATWHIVRSAVRQMKRAPRILEYPVWIGPLTEAICDELAPTVWKLDIASVLGRKQRAVLAHRSQLGEMQSENGNFTLPPDLLSVFVRGYEGFFEFRD